MSAKGLTMTVVGVAVAAGTYFGLETAFPRDKEKASGAAQLTSVEEVFGGTLQEPSAAPAEAAEAPAEESSLPPAEELAMDDSTPAQEPAVEESLPAAEEPQPAAPAPEAIEPEPQPGPEPAPEPVAKPQPAPAKPAAPSKPASTASSRKAEKLTQWWGPESATNLSVVYAGSAAYTRAIVLMFNGAFDDASSAAKNIRVTDASGKAVSGSWQIGANNKRMLLFPVGKTGTYTVSVGSGLVDRTGRKLDKSLRGPVRVQ